MFLMDSLVLAGNAAFLRKALTSVLRNLVPYEVGRDRGESYLLEGALNAAARVDV